MTKEFNEKFKAFLCENFILTHIAICLIGFVFVLNTQLYINIPINIIDFYPAFLYSYFPYKKTELIAYLVSVATMFFIFCLYTVIYLYKGKINGYFKYTFDRKILLLILFFDLISNINLTINMEKYSYYSLMVMTIWLCIFIFPFLLRIKLKKGGKNTNG